MKYVVAVLASFAPACECSTLEGGADAGRADSDASGAADASRDNRDAGDWADAGADAGDGRDAGLLETFCPPGDCTLEMRYCCVDHGGELSPSTCLPIPGVGDPDRGVAVNCAELPAAPGAARTDCGDGSEPCPLDLPWCCSGAGWPHDYCSQRPLFGWPCIDLQGREAGDTGRFNDPDDIRRCADDEPCEPEKPYCCDNLFCVVDPLHGWSCQIF